MTRIIGLALAFAGLALGAADFASAGRLRAIGEWWFQLAPNSLQLLQPAVERHLARWLWDPVILGVLEQPAAGLVLGLGAVLVGLSWLARRKIEI